MNARLTHTGPKTNFSSWYEAEATRWDIKQDQNVLLHWANFASKQQILLMIGASVWASQPAETFNATMSSFTFQTELMTNWRFRLAKPHNHATKGKLCHIFFGYTNAE